MAPAHFYSEMFLDLLHRRLYSIGINHPRIPWFTGHLFKGHSGVYS
jgi:hypothetical protein